MIEQIANLINQAGANKVTLTIQTDDSNNVTVVMNTFMPPAVSGKGSKEESKKVIALRHALSGSVIIHGQIGTVDVKLQEDLSQFAYGFEQGAAKLKTVSDLISNIESASANVTENKATTTTPAKAKKEPSKPVETVTQSAPPKADALPVQSSVFSDDDDDDCL